VSRLILKELCTSATNKHILLSVGYRNVLLQSVDTAWVYSWLSYVLRWCKEWK